MKKLLLGLLLAANVASAGNVPMLYQSDGMRVVGTLFIDNQIYDLTLCRATDIPTNFWVNAGQYAPTITFNGIAPNTVSAKYFAETGLGTRIIQIVEISCLDGLFKNGFDGS